MTKVVTAGMKTMIVPAYTPGSDSGKVTRRKDVHASAPRSSAASSRLLSIFMSTE